MVKPGSQTNLSQNQEQVVKQRNESSDSESSDRVMDDASDSLQGEESHVESLEGTETSNPAAESPEHTAGAQRDQTADTKEPDASEESLGRPGEGESDGPNSSGDKVVKTAPGDIPTQRPPEESKNVISPSGTGEKTNAADKKTAETREPVLDHNANMDQKGQSDQKNKSKQETTEQKVAFGSETPSQVTLINPHEASCCS